MVPSHLEQQVGLAEDHPDIDYSTPPDCVDDAQVQDDQPGPANQNFAPVGGFAPGSGPEAIPRDQLEREAILHVLQRTKYKKSKAAQILGISRPTLDAKIDKFGLTRESILNPEA